MSHQETFFQVIDKLGLTDAQHSAVIIAGTDYATADRVEVIEYCTDVLNKCLNKQVETHEVAGWSGVVKHDVEIPLLTHGSTVTEDTTPPIVDFFAQLGSYFNPKNAA